mgnify:CR=1 FL=1
MLLTCPINAFTKYKEGPTLNQFRRRFINLKAVAHYSWNCEKVVIVHTRYNFFFHNYNDFSTVLNMDNGFYNDFFRKISVKIFVVYEGL